ncbi:MAG: hypothetical protein COA66_12410 [Arcobacter sp.]|nr:MAG: hypothetical protein COA66_12410 [Arcobacter sp.]
MNKNINKVAYNLVISIFISLLFITVEQTYRIYNDILMFNITIKAILEQILINFIIISLLSKRAIFITYAIISVFVWFQLLHFSYFGTWIFPLEYYLFFTKFQETYDTFKTILDITILPSLSVAILLFLIFIIIKNLKEDRLKVPFLSYILLALLIFLPLKTFLKDSKKGHRPNVEYYPIKNTVNTLSYLLGNIMPKKLSGKSGFEQKIIETPNISINNPNVNIIMIMGESLNRNFMSLYDYKIKTTPFLDSIKNENNFLYKKAIAAGVVTDVAIPSFFNMIKKPDGTPQILTTNTCLFKMAQNNGFTTHFYSAQAQDQLAQLKSYLCLKWVNKYIDGTSKTMDIDKPALDEFLLETIDKIDFSEPNFVVLHQRGSHTPFVEDYPKEFNKFTKKNTQDKNISQNTLEYQNSVYYTDFVLSQIIKKIKTKTKRPTYFVFTSDHATNVGDKNRNGHGRLDYDSIYQVPFFMYSINNAKNISNKFSDFEYISHYQISQVLSVLLGYKFEGRFFNKKETYYVNDSDISGLSGYLKLTFDKNNQQIKKLIE